MKPDAVRGHVDLLLLAAVRDRPGHGYALIQELRRRSGGELDLPEGTVYPALHRLERAGLVTSAWSTAEGARRRRVYTLTPLGGTKLAKEVAEWTRLVGAVEAIVGT
jgi:DNA-binding PadR family transcriptional regulator